MKARLALVEPSAAAARSLEPALKRGGWRVDRYRSLRPFLEAFARRRPDAALVDLSVPGMSGRELIRALRTDPKNKTLILVALSERHSPAEAVEAFAAGADEYFSLPVDPDFLTVRLTSLLRRVPQPEEDRSVRHGPIALHPDSRQCRVAEKAVRLSRLEFDLLLQFVRNPNRVFTRGWLIDQLFHGDRRRGVRAVDRHICALRGKLGECGERLQTLVGIGYCFSDRKTGR
ncbi:MAG: response regulator transcription factor [Elusimicrobia bacterium]|nr:response regulator transcription factor [Elusimicrobiota bacterium]